MARIPVLMYHNVTPNESAISDLTIHNQRFEEQLQYIIEKKYTTLFASDLVHKRPLPQKSIVITFDDVTENQLLCALPLLEKYNCKATFFVPFAYVGSTDEWNNGSEKIMTVEQLKSLDSSIIELGHHSFAHRKYSSLSVEEIQADFDKSVAFIEQNQLNVFPSLAYPYGNFPKKDKARDSFFKLLEHNSIQLAFRIGNRVNSFPFKNKFLIKRIDVKGQDNLMTFKWKLRLGKLRLF
jgi:peptidoglycan/xylan/chitin deacetylase (PgdA/CDA1 family)